MTQNMQVLCLLDRYWEPDDMDWKGTTVRGQLIDIATQTADDLSGKLIPIGVVLVEDESHAENHTLQCIPIEFIRYQPDEE